MNQELSDLVYGVVVQIPKGKVATYKQVAERVNRLNPKVRITPRLVGKILHSNPNPTKIPCHRVVFWNGSLSENYAFGGRDAQKKKLMQEGIVFLREKILLNFCLWKNQE